MDPLEECEIHKAGVIYSKHILNEKTSLESNSLYETAIDIERIIARRK